ncbi:YajQ family cyclic di-GMP-binding protein [Candidatus Magnetaquicoccus inordinatus]|uniref:YajQ family cyclic di-GMP-binding protein n=1 Tax=Candidatus Magnetaquicoccus inordinatus TaxID=2496818 RepID=UPI00102BBBC2|nr:YajQ family cyclic di-GMP-binding protein [Candidatus Magnetaquicoccus inordinatus]
MPSFDIVSETDLQEVDNAVNQVSKEIITRYDFKNAKCRVERKEAEITLHADDEYKREQVIEILKEKLIRRKVDIRVLDYGTVEPASGGTVRQVVTVRQGIEAELAKKLVKMIKDSKIKVQAAIQGVELRITGKKRDDLQEVITLLKADTSIEQPLQFTNFRD